MSMNEMTPERKVMQARTNLVLDQPFFGALILRLPCSPDPACKTLWTNGTRIGYNPKFVDSLSLAETEGVLAHEVLHCANGHPWRESGRQHGKWNMACDYAINPIVLDSKMQLPKDALLNPAYKGLSAEAVYPNLPDSPPGGKQSGDQQGDCDIRQDTSSEAEANEADFEVATLQAAQIAKSQGKLPGGLERLIDSIKNPAVDWKAVLHRFIQQAAKADYSWKMPNRRYAAGGLYLPELRSEQMPPVVVAIDTSGSIDDALLNQFGAEVSAIASECQPETVHVVYCDTQVNGVDSYERGDQVTFRKDHHRGGTAFEPPFDWVNKEGVEPACLIYLTDMEGSFPSVAPEYPVLWVTPAQGVQAPFGETVEVRL